jgi:hypothetical protein
MKMKQGGVKIIRPINNNDNIQVIKHRITIWKLHYTLKLKIVMTRSSELSWRDPQNATVMWKKFLYDNNESSCWNCIIWLV